MPNQQLQFRHRIERGIEDIEESRDYLLQRFLGVLEGLGEKDCARLIRSLGGDSAAAVPLKGSQALSIYFQILNLIEEAIANAKSTEWRRELNQPDSGGWHDYLGRLKASGHEPTAIRKAVEAATIEPVFTKHPTESKREAILRLHRELYRLVRRQHDYADLTPEKEEEIAELLLDLLWRSGEIYTRKPKVEDENKNVLFYLVEIFPHTLRPARNRLRKAWKRVFPDFKGRAPELPSLSFGSWVGGDRDGHPFVTSEVTATTLSSLREAAIEIHDRFLAELEQNLTFNEYTHAVPQALTDFLERRGIEAEHLEEPWSVCVHAIRESLQNSLRLNVEPFYENEEALLEDLQVLEDALKAVRGERLIERFLEPLYASLKTFGFSAARLDIRQNSQYLGQAMAQILEQAGIAGGADYEQWEEEKKVEFLSTELASARPFTSAWTSLPEEAEEWLRTLKAVSGHMDRYGEAGLGCIIVSMTRSLSDLLLVYVLGREAGLTFKEDGKMVCRLPVTPLFETMDDLENSVEITEAFLKHPVTRNSHSRLDRLVGRRGDPVTVMLGYSDSNKDCGIWASQWTLYNTQKRLLEVAKRQKRSIRFFHGRGGTVGRGAGPTHRFLEGLPQAALLGGLRMTEQGEVIGQKYNTVESATTSLENLLAGGAGAPLLPINKAQIAKATPVLHFVTEASKNAYQSLLAEEDFISFYRTATPIDAIEQTTMGSRPSRRTGTPTLQDLRAIPWVFSWNQSRFYLPGWFGVGTALEQLLHENKEGYDCLGKVYPDWPFLRYMLFNIESTLASVSGEMIQAYASLVKDKRLRDHFMGIIEEELERTRLHISTLLARPIEEGRPRLMFTLKLRDQGLRRLHREQIRLLKEWRQCRAGTKKHESLLTSLLLNINAIASGLRTTG